MLCTCGQPLHFVRWKMAFAYMASETNEMLALKSFLGALLMVSTYGYVPCPFSPIPWPIGVFGRESLRTFTVSRSRLDEELVGPVS